MRFLRIALCAALLAASAAAQTRRGDMVVDVPFAFQAGGHEFPAGHYIVAMQDDAVLRIFNRETSGVFVATHAARRSESDGSKLVFHRYGDIYFLAGAWVNGDTTGRELYRSRAERELADRNAEMELAVVHSPK